MADRLYRVCQWVARIAYVNLLWLSLTALGIVILGLMPATAALFSVTRRWVRGEFDFPVGRSFWLHYRAEFFAANRFGWVFALVGALLVADLFFVEMTNSPLLQASRFVVLILALAYLLVIPYAFPVFAHYELKVLQQVKLALVLGLSHPLGGLMMLVGLTGFSMIFVALPGLLPFFGASAPALWMTWIAHHTFDRLRTDTR